MHIKPDLFAILSASAGTSNRSSASRVSFQEVLRAASDRPAAKPESPAELAAALRLRMLQQAIDLGDEGGENHSLPALSLFAALGPKNQPVVSQNVDFAELQPVAPVTRIAYPAPPAPGAPTSFPDIIERAAARYQVAPEVVRAVIRAESGFNPNAVSPAGAQGLMQLMPGTARELGVTDPFDPEQNVMAGTRYLKQMLGRYGGDLEKALAAYNWGPGNLDRSRDGCLPNETRHYIARIQGFLATGG